MNNKEFGEKLKERFRHYRISVVLLLDSIIDDVIAETTLNVDCAKERRVK